jgi:hypothetical protein
LIELTDRQARVHAVLKTLGTATTRELADHLGLTFAMVASALRKMLLMRVVCREQHKHRVAHAGLHPGEGLQAVSGTYFPRVLKSNWVDVWSVIDDG